MNSSSILVTVDKYPPVLPLKSIIKESISCFSNFVNASLNWEYVFWPKILTLKYPTFLPLLSSISELTENKVIFSLVTLNVNSLSFLFTTIVDVFTESLFNILATSVALFPLTEVPSTLTKTSSSFNPAFFAGESSNTLVIFIVSSLVSCICAPIP